MNGMHTLCDGSHACNQHHPCTCRTHQSILSVEGLSDHACRYRRSLSRQETESSGFLSRLMSALHPCGKLAPRLNPGKGGYLRDIYDGNHASNLCCWPRSLHHSGITHTQLPVGFSPRVPFPLRVWLRVLVGVLLQPLPSDPSFLPLAGNPGSTEPGGGDLLRKVYAHATLVLKAGLTALLQVRMSSMRHVFEVV